MGNLPANFGISETLRSRLTVWPTPVRRISRDLATFDLKSAAEQKSAKIYKLNAATNEKFKI